MDRLTWQALDDMVEGDPLALRDRAWAEVERIRKKNVQQGLRMADLETALAAQQSAVLQLHERRELTSGAAYCRHCLDVADEHAWPCPTARVLGVTT